MGKVLLEVVECDMEVAGRWIRYLKGVDGKNPELTKLLERQHGQAIKLFERKKTGLAQFCCNSITETAEREVNKILGPKCGVCSRHKKPHKLKFIKGTHICIECYAPSSQRF